MRPNRHQGWQRRSLNYVRSFGDGSGWYERVSKDALGECSLDELNWVLWGRHGKPVKLIATQRGVQ